MKQISLWIGLLLCSSLTKAQFQFLNPGFESWTNHTVNGFSFADPENWYSLNELMAFGFSQTTIQSNIKHSGSYSVQLVSINGSFGKLPGLLTLKPILNEEGDPELQRNMVAYNLRPNAIRFWYRSYPEALDANSMFCVLTKWNASKNDRDTIGTASWYQDSTVTTFTSERVSFVYQNSLSPDSIFLLFGSSADGFNPVPGSELFIDDIQLDYSTGLNNNVQPEIRVFPNPFTDHIYLDQVAEGTTVQVSNLEGRLLYETQYTRDEIVLPTISAGLYFLHLSCEDGTRRKSILLQKID